MQLSRIAADTLSFNFPKTISTALQAVSLTAAALISFASAPSSHAQCWLNDIGVPGLNGNAQAAVSWDPDGVGPLPAELVVGGTFLNAGGNTVNRIARWNGTSWAGFGTGMNGSVSALTVLPGNVLIAGGSFLTAGGTTVNRVARWTGTGWAAYGTGMTDIVLSVAPMANGDLVAGGRFANAGGNTVNCIARWDGANWIALGTGIAGAPPYVNALLTQSNGDLIAGGFFSSAGGTAVNSIAKWNGSAWSALGVGITGVVNGMTTMPNGDLVVGGQFTNSGANIYNRIARWNGTSWSGFGTGVTGPGFPLVWSVAVLPQGDLIAAGDFNTAGGVSANFIARWNGLAWSPLGSGTDTIIRTLAVLNDGTLAVGGHFAAAGGAPSSRISRWAFGDTAPNITDSPNNVRTCSSGAAVFTVFAFGGPGSLSYQWQHETAPGSDVWTDLDDGSIPDLGTVSGADSPSLIITDFGPDAPGDYRCVVSNTCDSATSTAATLTVCNIVSDLNCDGEVSLADLTTLLANYGTIGGATHEQGDIDNNGDVDLADLTQLLGAFGASCP